VREFKEIVLTKFGWERRTYRVERIPIIQPLSDMNDFFEYRPLDYYRYGEYPCFTGFRVPRLDTEDVGILIKTERLCP